MKINAIIINGRHGGQFFPIEYSPVISLAITNPSQISMGEEYDKSVRLNDRVDYYECFRSVDGKSVMYSTDGRWDDVKYALLTNLKKTYPIDFISSNPFIEDEIKFLNWYRENKRITL